MKKSNTIAQTLVKTWRKAQISRHAAAISYYTLFALPALLFIFLTFADAVLGDKGHLQFFARIEPVIGTTATQFLASILEQAALTPHTTITRIGSSLVLILSIIGVLRELRHALNAVLTFSRRKENIFVTIRDYVSLIIVLLCIGLLLLLSLGISIGISAYARYVPDIVPAFDALAAMHQLLSFGVLTALLILLYRMLPYRTLRWSSILPSAFVASSLFLLGTFGLTALIGISQLTALFGAAATLLIILMWISYSAHVFLFGAILLQFVHEEGVDERLLGGKKR